MCASSSCRRPLAYWELPDDLRRGLPQHLVGGDEYFVMSKINMGLQLAVLHEMADSERAPTEFAELPIDQEDYSYYDPIASILMAAMLRGHDVERLVEAAMDQVRTLVDSARLEASRRQRSSVQRAASSRSVGACSFTKRGSSRTRASRHHPGGVE